MVDCLSSCHTNSKHDSQASVETLDNPVEDWVTPVEAELDQEKLSFGRLRQWKQDVSVVIFARIVDAIAGT